MSDADSCAGPQTETGRPGRRHRRLMQVPVLSSHKISIGSKTSVIVRYNRDIFVKCFDREVLYFCVTCFNSVEK